MFEILIAQLLTWSKEIKNQTEKFGNTETLVGGLFEQIVLLIQKLVAYIVDLTFGWLWKEPVPTKNDLSVKYPTPAKGWASLVQDEGVIYVYDGTTWVNTGVTNFPSDVATKTDLEAKADKENADGYLVVYAKGGKIPVPKDIVTYIEGTSNIDISGAERRLNITMDATGKISGTLPGTSVNNSIVLWRLKLEPDTAYRLQFSNTFTNNLYIYLHDTKSDASAKYVYNTLDVDGDNRYTTFTTNSTAIYLTCYLKLVYGGTANYDISNTIQIYSDTEGDTLIKAGSVSLSANQIKKTLYTETYGSVIDWSSQETRNGSLEDSGSWTNSGVTSVILWRLKLKPNTQYNFSSPAIKANSKFVLLHTSTDNTAAAFKYSVNPEDENLVFTTNSTAIYATCYLRLLYTPSNVDFDIRSTLKIIEGYREDIIIGGSSYNLDQILNPTATDSGAYYNVKSFGVTGDGVTDDTPAIQSAMDHVIDAGGGTLFFPNGIYRLATIQQKYGVKAHLIIKPTGGAANDPDRPYRTMLRLQGQGMVNTSGGYANHLGATETVQLQRGAILKSDIIGDLYTDTSTMHTSVLASGGKAWANYFMNGGLIRLQDLAIQVHVEPGKYSRLCGIDMAFAQSVYVDNVLIFPDLTNYEQTAPSNDGHYSCGFIAPILDCNPEQDFRNIYIKTGFRYGFLFSEHSIGHNCIAWVCENAYTFSFMYHPAYFTRLHSQGCKNIISALDVNVFKHKVGNSYVFIDQVGVEANLNQAPSDFNYTTFVNDPNNRLRGSLKYHIVQSIAGVNNGLFSKNGGTGIKTETVI